MCGMMYNIQATYTLTNLSHCCHVRARFILACIATDLRPLAGRLKRYRTASPLLTPITCHKHWPPPPPHTPHFFFLCLWTEPTPLSYTHTHTHTHKKKWVRSLPVMCRGTAIDVYITILGLHDLRGQNNMNNTNKLINSTPSPPHLCR